MPCYSPVYHTCVVISRLSFNHNTEKCHQKRTKISTTKQFHKQAGHAALPLLLACMLLALATLRRSRGFTSNVSLSFLPPYNLTQTPRVSGCAGPEKHTHMPRNVQQGEARQVWPLPAVLTQVWSGEAFWPQDDILTFTGSSDSGLPGQRVRFGPRPSLLSAQSGLTWTVDQNLPHCSQTLRSPTSARPVSRGPLAWPCVLVQINHSLNTSLSYPG